MRLQAVVGVLGSALFACGSSNSLMAQQTADAACSKLADLHTPNLTITSATLVNAGQPIRPGGPGGPAGGPAGGPGGAPGGAGGPGGPGGGAGGPGGGPG